MTDRPTRGPSVDTVVFGDEAVLFDERTGMVHRLNHTAATIWELLDGRTIDNVVQAVAQATDEPIDQVRDGVVETISRLRDAGLLFK